MKKIWQWLKMVYFAALFLAAGAAFAAATFAWFTANQEVETSRITARTGQGQLTLYIGRTEDTLGTQPVALAPCDQELMPVSTADLQEFVYNPMTNDGIADQFLPAQDTLYYHDTIYLKAVSTGNPAGARLAVYLDADSTITDLLQGQLLTAARLGLRFSDGTFRILALSAENQGSGNTGIGGTLLEAGKVVTLTDGVATARDDPAIALEEVLSTRMATPLARLTPDTAYRVDIYFYLEGCDPDCVSEKVGLDRAALELGFYGVPIWED